MKKRFKPVLLILGLFVFAGLVLTSCGGDDDGTPAVDKSVLKDSIAVAVALHANTTEGVNDGQFSAAARTALQTAITAAQAVDANATLTQAQVNAAVQSLNAALAAYRAAEIAPIAEADLVGHWSFDEGSGTTAHDAANGFDGTFKTGPTTWGSGFPTWTADRKGVAGKAIAFDKGANVEIPYNTAINPKQLSISLWVSAAEIRENNRFIGLQSWIAYKFQLQSTNRPFLTVATADRAIDHDGITELPINEWHHIVATFGNGHMIFYVDGVQTKDWDEAGEAKSISSQPYNLVFGQDFPTDKYAAGTENFDQGKDKIIPLAYGGYFHGSLDEIRIYKAVLTESQVQQLYDREK